VSGTVGYDSTTRIAKFTPAATLAPATKYLVGLVATGTSGGAVTAGGNWSFTTAQPATAPGVCPCNLFTDATVPGIVDSGDNAAVTLGVRFTSQNAGTITGIKFYKGPGNTGTHVGSLWSASGALLASASFTGESTAGWQSVTFASPVSVTAGTEYTAAYRTTAGHYSVTAGAFSNAYTRGPLTVPANGGSFSYANGFPGTRVTTSYLVDLTFQPTAVPFTVVGLSPANGATGVDPAAVVRATLSSPVANGYQLSATVQGTPVSGTTSLSADRTVISFTPTSPLPTSATVNASLTNVTSTTGSALPPQSWSFTTAATAPVYTQYSLFGTQTPVVPAATDDTSPVELGMSFSSSVAGSVTAIRFHKGTGNTGTHTGSLWSSTGQRLATVTFSGESATGWQTAQLATPIALTVGQTYVVSYFAPNGHYAYTTNFFQSPLTNGPLTAGTAANGRFFYGAAGGFPTTAWQASNYFVDVVFAVPGSPSPVTVTTTTPASGATGVATNTPITAQLSAAVTGTPPVITVAAPSGAVAGTSAYNATTRVVTFTPTQPLGWSTAYAATVSISGATPSGGSWSFTTAAEPPTVDALNIFAANAVPASPNWNDPDAVQVGVRFSSSVAGSVTGIRFYKGAQNSGAHVGYLWSNTGTLLATVSFPAETASGWQTAMFSQPVVIQPGVEYRASYHSTVGRYAVDLNGLASAVTNGPLSTPAQGSAYVYGTAYPANLSSHNYWVDVFFVPSG
jgi:hypothetical protein